jgi:hypothetical protein
VPRFLGLRVSPRNTLLAQTVVQSLLTTGETLATRVLTSFVSTLSPANLRILDIGHFLTKVPQGFEIPFLEISTTSRPTRRYFVAPSS